jgi:curved DNA-binding protein CbpA
MARQTPEDINKPFDRPGEDTRRCEHPGCTLDAEHRAPASRDRLEEYRWFCLEHVRDYNKAWNYYAGMSEADIERHRRRDTVWQRPSWPFGQFGENARYDGDYRIRDGFGFFSDDGAEGSAPKPMTEEQKALAEMDLKEPVTFEDVKTRYKNLVKELHPDANGGDRDAEERLKVVNQAYAALKMSFA